ncbi:hypothetical protein HGO21_16385 [Acinetobacter sp. CUI P1]|nr:hypothetical protein [Acinetobacter sp. CUI P1]
MAKSNQNKSKKIKDEKLAFIIQRPDPSTIPICRVAISHYSTISSTLTMIKSIINQLKRHPGNRIVKRISIHSHWLEVELDLSNNSTPDFCVSELIQKLSFSLSQVGNYPADLELKEVLVDNEGIVTIKKYSVIY